MGQRMDHDEELDATGLLCPLPVLKTRKQLQGLAPGTVLRVMADDPMAATDIPAFCAEMGHEMLFSRVDGARQTYLIRRK